MSHTVYRFELTADGPNVSLSCVPLLPEPLDAVLVPLCLRVLEAHEGEILDPVALGHALAEAMHLEGPGDLQFEVAVHSKVTRTVQEWCTRSIAAKLTGTKEVHGTISVRDRGQLRYYDPRIIPR